jgi:hypothetical protein
MQEAAFFDDPKEGLSHRTVEMVTVLGKDVDAASEIFSTKLADGLRYDCDDVIIVIIFIIIIIIIIILLLLLAITITAI